VLQRERKTRLLQINAVDIVYLKQTHVQQRREQLEGILIINLENSVYLKQLKKLNSNNPNLLTITWRGFSS
jgi:hypothetical protein